MALVAAQGVPVDSPVGVAVAQAVQGSSPVVEQKAAQEVPLSSLAAGVGVVVLPQVADYSPAPRRGSGSLWRTCTADRPRRTGAARSY